MAEYYLKIAPPWFEAVASGHRTVELRREDTRRFAAGDVLILAEWTVDRLERARGEVLARGAFTGRTCRVVVTHVLRHDDVPDLLPPGVAALSIRREAKSMMAPDPSYGRPDRWCRRCGAALIECPCCAAVFCAECRTLGDTPQPVRYECPKHGVVDAAETVDLGPEEGRICLMDYGQCQRPVTVWPEG